MGMVAYYLHGGEHVTHVSGAAARLGRSPASSRSVPEGSAGLAGPDSRRRDHATTPLHPVHKQTPEARGVRGGPSPFSLLTTVRRAVAHHAVDACPYDYAPRGHARRWR